MFVCIFLSVFHQQREGECPCMLLSVFKVPLHKLNQ